MSVKNKFPLRIGFFLLVAVLVAGCAPIVRMTIEHRDITGGLIGRYVLTPSSSEVVIPNYQRSQTLDAFVEAESSDGLESSIIIGEGTCWGGTGGAGTVS